MAEDSVTPPSARAKLHRVTSRSCDAPCQGLSWLCHGHGNEGGRCTLLVVRGFKTGFFCLGTHSAVGVWHLKVGLQQ